VPEQTALEKELREGLVLSLRGDKAAYTRFLEKTAAMVRGYLARRQRSVERVEDLVQDVLLAIHRKKHLYSPERPVLPWIFAIARYRLIDAVRADARRPAAAEWEEAFDSLAAREGGLDQALVIEEMLECLNEKQKKVLMMAKLDGMPLAEVAAKTGLSLAAVKVTVHRAVRAVRKGMEARAYED